MRLAIANRRCPHFLGLGGRCGLRVPSVVLRVVVGVAVVDLVVEGFVLNVVEVVLVVAEVGRTSPNTIGINGVVDCGGEVGRGTEVVMSKMNSASGSNGFS